MALAAGTIWDVRSGGSDTLNGGGFNANNANMATDLTTTAGTGNTASPVVTSASYNFVAGDVGAWVYIQSGTNWTPGWYQIASVAASQATLTASVGSGILSRNNEPVAVSTVAGVATVGTPTSGVWTIDYSQQNAAQFTFTDMNIGAAGATFTSAGHPVGKNFVGNLIQVTGGTNATTGVYEIISTSGTTATTDRNWATGASSNGAGGLGGGFASPGFVGSVKVAGNNVAVKAATYTLTTVSQNVATGAVNETTGGTDTTRQSYWFGWNTNRHRTNLDTTQPVITGAVGLTGYTLFQVAALNVHVWNMGVDGNARTTTIGFGSTSGANFGGSRFSFCSAKNCTNGGFSMGADGNILFACYATTCSTTAAFQDTGAEHVAYYYCVANANTFTGFSINSRGLLSFCISANNTGASSHGIAGTNGATTEMICDHCLAYGNGGAGYHPNTSSARQCSFTSCGSINNTGKGWDDNGSVCDMAFLLNCYGFGNSSNYVVANFPNVSGFITLTGDPTVNGAAGNFALNNTAGAGASVRAAGYAGVFEGISTTGFADSGPVQHQDAGGSTAAGDDGGMCFINIRETLW